MGEDGSAVSDEHPKSPTIAIEATAGTVNHFFIFFSFPPKEGFV